MRIIEEKTEEDLSDVVAYVSDVGLHIGRRNGPPLTLIFMNGDDYQLRATEEYNWTPEHAIGGVFRKGDRITLEF